MNITIKSPNQISSKIIKNNRIGNKIIGKEEININGLNINGALHSINSEEKFNPTVDFYYCHKLCRYRNSYCEYKNY